MNDLSAIISELKKVGWEQYMGSDDFYHWKTKGSNRYVDIDGPYIDIYIYSEGQKYGGWLNNKEISLFFNLISVLPEEKETQNNVLC